MYFLSNIVCVFIAIIFIFLSFYLYAKSLHSKVDLFSFLFVSSLSIFLLLASNCISYFTEDGINEATLYHLRYGFDGAGFSDYAALIAFVVFVLMLFFILLFLSVKKSLENKSKNIFVIFLTYLFILISFILNSGVNDVQNALKIYLDNKKYSDPKVYNDFYKYYKEPKIFSENKDQKNLVFIYAESLERTYFDEKIFPDLVTNLKKIETESISFTNVAQVNNTGWTVGGMTASLCGIPLFTSGGGNSMEGMDNFLSSAVCLGDLMKDVGYNLSYIAGANLNFAGKGALLRNHGFDSVYGFDDIDKEGLNIVDDFGGWGVHDDVLFDILYERFEELSMTGKKFSLFTLTLDTHQPTGSIAKSCKSTSFFEYRDGKNQMLNAVKCSDYLISNFINRIATSPYADNTIIVLVSDHLAMKNTASELLDKGDRKNLFLIIDPSSNERKKISTKGSMLDVGSTVLSYMSLSNNLGLGRNLLDESNEMNSDRNIIQEKSVQWRNPILQFWNFPQVKNKIEFDIANKQFFIDERKFKLPALIELDEKLHTTIRFAHRHNQKSLFEKRKGIKKDTFFFLVDYCSEIDDSYVSNKKDLCLLRGNGRKNIEMNKLEQKKYIFSHDRIYDLFNVSEEKLNDINKFEMKRVAHAGGSFGGMTYTNSIEALNENMANNFSYFEIDFSFTKDRELVCIHDWKNNFKNIFGFTIQEPLTLDEFYYFIEKNKFHNCTLKTLSKWLSDNPDTFIITDVKGDNVQALKKIIETIPNAQERVIPQIYDPNNFTKIKSMGFKNVIWTLYRYSGDNDEIMNIIKNFYGSFAVTIDENRAKTSLLKELQDSEVPVYVHTINNQKTADDFISNNYKTEIYTDVLFPQ